MKQPSYENLRFYIITRKKLNIPNKEILKEINDVWPSSSCSYSFVQKWGVDDDWKDSKRPGRPKESIKKVKIEEIKSLLELYPGSSIRYLKDITNLSYRQVRFILLEILELKKLHLRWIPSTLTESIREKRILFSKKNLEIFESSPSKLKNVLTGDESWFYLENKKMKKNKKEWRNPNDVPSKIPKIKINEEKFLFSIFFYYSGLITINVLGKNKKLNGEWYVNKPLNEIKTFFENKRTKRKTKGLYLLHDNAPPHKKETVKIFLKELEIIELDHPPYSPDLSPCDYWLFPLIKRELGVNRFENREKIIEKIDEICRSIKKKNIQMP